ncbi:EcsC family protein [Microlunatus soli]|uniref:EcsC protein family protein n=1 Tax=Microlunatus soli TaxID=630515 RepID=A0A1H1TKZ6_9ACTN|nr:EcsC protein family protein [Microlunatus soli]
MPSAKDVGRAVARRLQPVTTTGPQAAGTMLRRIVEVAIDGTGRFPSARTTAARHLEKHGGSVDAAIESLIDSHVRIGTAQGFVTNLGGIVVAAVTIPANLAGVAVVQVRMIAAIAHLRGYDIDDRRVRTALVLCLLGGEQIGRRVASGRLPTTPLAIATAPVFDPNLDARVSEAVVGDLLARVGGKHLPLLITRRIPLLGGGVGAVVDGLATYQIGQFAKGELVRRRALSN